jgi:hypothetical protein
MAISSAGLVTADEFESLVERALSQIEGRIALEDLRALMESVGFMDDGLGGDNVTVH